MSTETVLVSEVIFATRERLYNAWLDSAEHSAFTGDTAVIEPVEGGHHSAFSGYATGQLLSLEPHRRIIESWRTSEFPDGAPDSRLEITFEDTLGGTLVTLLHTAIPSGQSDSYRDGWLKLYFARMKKYFADEIAPPHTPELAPDALAPAPARTIASKPAPRPQPRRSGARAARKVTRPAARKKASARKRPAGKKPAKPARPARTAKKAKLNKTAKTVKKAKTAKTTKPARTAKKAKKPVTNHRPSKRR